MRIALNFSRTPERQKLFFGGGSSECLQEALLFERNSSSRITKKVTSIHLHKILLRNSWGGVDVPYLGHGLFQQHWLVIAGHRLTLQGSPHVVPHH